MLIGPEYEERLKRVLESRAMESVFADPLTFPRPTVVPPAIGRARAAGVLDDEPPPRERGVYLEDIPAPGETWYKMVLSNGKVGIIHLPNELVDAGLYQNLCRRLDQLDPVTTLRAI